MALLLVGEKKKTMLLSLGMALGCALDSEVVFIGRCWCEGGPGPYSLLRALPPAASEAWRRPKDLTTSQLLFTQSRDCFRPMCLFVHSLRWGLY